jgi:hypothetical protein
VFARRYITEERLPSPAFFSIFGGPASECEARLFALKIPTPFNTMTEIVKTVNMISQKKETDNGRQPFLKCWMKLA